MEIKYIKNTPNEKFSSNRLEDLVNRFFNDGTWDCDIEITFKKNEKLHHVVIWLYKTPIDKMYMLTYIEENIEMDYEDFYNYENLIDCLFENLEIDKNTNFENIII